MKAYKESFVFLPRNQWEVIDLPSDLVVFPIVIDGKTDVMHSETTGKWYVLIKVELTEEDNHKDFDNFITCGLLASGSWLDCYPYIPKHFAYVPFCWGEPLKSHVADNVQYIPIWESVPTGKYYNDPGSEFDGFPIKHDIYKIIHMNLDIFRVTADNTIQSNYNTRFEVEDFGEDLKGLISSLQVYTGKVF